MTDKTLPIIPPTARVFAILLGVAVPAVVFGRSVFAVIVALALITLCISRPWRAIAGDLWRHSRTPLGVFVLLTFAAWLPNVFMSHMPSRSFEAVARTLIFVALASVFWSGLASHRDLVTLSRRAFTIMAGISVLYSLLALNGLPEIYWFLRLKGWLPQPLSTQLKGFSALAVIIVPIVALTAYRASAIWKMACVLVATGYLYIVWESYNRSAMAGFLAVLISVVVAGFVYKGRKRQVLVGLLVFVAVMAGALAWLHATRGYYQEAAPPGNWLFPVWLVDYERQIIWSKALEIARLSPWFGIGANTINFMPGANGIIPGTENLHVIPAHPHNWMVEVFAETGAVGLAMLLVAIVAYSVRTLLTLRRTGNIGLIAVIAIMAGYWGSGLFNFSYWSAWWQVSFLMGIVLAGLTLPDKQSNNVPWFLIQL